AAAAGATVVSCGTEVGACATADATARTATATSTVGSRRRSTGRPGTLRQAVAARRHFVARLTGGRRRREGSVLTGASSIVDGARQALARVLPPRPRGLAVGIVDRGHERVEQAGVLAPAVHRAQPLEQVLRVAAAQVGGRLDAEPPQARRDLRTDV